ncbi:uncharacterized protein HD556DRAFT_1437258 [Suillus plorans]|uniref:Uncharacterized protein n=1 Tax=Suillus plorans TaxID=116603 RepID=A0A9P7DX93_9AGAM|nr:uncharacterized protein HD556DRAFT_1437258 [Suillus plorans]KAG1805098.1 hypothetical protein HD556DRAFT_1437258 [Suillus plorans]
MGPPISIGNNMFPGPSVIIEDIHNMGPWSAGPSDMGYYVDDTPTTSTLNPTIPDPNQTTSTDNRSTIATALPPSNPSTRNNPSPKEILSPKPKDAPFTMSDSASSCSSCLSASSHASALPQTQTSHQLLGLDGSQHPSIGTIHRRKHAYWEAVICDPQFALRLDSYLNCTNDEITFNLIQAFRGTDALTGDIARVDLARDMSLSTVSTRYNQGKIKQALLNLLELRNFHAAVMAVEEEQAFNPPPNPVKVVKRAVYDRAPTPFIPQPHSETPEPIPNVAQLTNPKIDRLYEEYERKHYAPCNPSPSFDTISITIPELDECTPESPAVNPDDWVPTDAVPHLSIGSPHPLPTPRHRNCHPRATSVLSLGLPLSHAHHPHTQNYSCHFTHEEAQDEAISQAQRDATETTQVYRSNVVCRQCHVFGHKQKHCAQYFCRICGQFAPKHLTPFCPHLDGKKILHRGPSQEQFYQDMRQLEAAYDQDAARIEQEREENALKATAWLKDLDFDPDWYTNQDD